MLENSSFSIFLMYFAYCRRPKEERPEENNMQKDKMPEYVCEFLKNEDEYTFKHSSRVADVARVIGKTMQLCSADMELLDEASRLHDVGKILHADHIIIPAFQMLF